MARATGLSFARRFSDLPRDTGRRVACVVDRIDRLVLRAHSASFAFAALFFVGMWWVAGEGAFWPALLLVPWALMLATHIGCSWAVRWALRVTARPHRRRLAA